jgi:hypothetical protein
MLMLLGQRFEESLICFWLVIQVTVLFVVTFYFCSQICDSLPLSLSLSLLLSVYICVYKYAYTVVCICACLNFFCFFFFFFLCVCGDAERILTNS